MLLGSMAANRSAMPRAPRKARAAGGATPFAAASCPSRWWLVARFFWYSVLSGSAAANRSPISVGVDPMDAHVGGGLVPAGLVGHGFTDGDGVGEPWVHD